MRGYNKDRINAAHELPDIHDPGESIPSGYQEIAYHIV
jgi:hypothetical protein